jgi:hypothetical protein
MRGATRHAEVSVRHELSQCIASGTQPLHFGLQPLDLVDHGADQTCWHAHFVDDEVRQLIHNVVVTAHETTFA